jgi:hypothetical protein
MSVPQRQLFSSPHEISHVLNRTTHKNQHRNRGPKAKTRLFTSSLFKLHPLSQAFIEIDNKSRELRLFV